jgi:TRAP-type C4-dicarboxylate transport system permease large subunit
VCSTCSELARSLASPPSVTLVISLSLSASLAISRRWASLCLPPLLMTLSMSLPTICRRKMAGQGDDAVQQAAAV